MASSLAPWAALVTLVLLSAAPPSSGRPQNIHRRKFQYDPDPTISAAHVRGALLKTLSTAPSLKKLKFELRLCLEDLQEDPDSGAFQSGLYTMCVSTDNAVYACNWRRPCEAK